MAKKIKKEYSDKAKPIIEALTVENLNELCEGNQRIINRVEDKVGKFEIVKSFGGNSGDGEKVVRVFHFTENNVFLRIRGYFSSEEGIDFYNSSFEEVYPREKIVTVYSTTPPVSEFGDSLTGSEGADGEGEDE